MARTIFYEPLDGLKKCEELYDALWKKRMSTFTIDYEEQQHARDTLLIFFKNACQGYLSRKQVSEWKKKYLIAKNYEY